MQLRLTAKLGTPSVCGPHPALRATFPQGKVYPDSANNPLHLITEVLPGQDGGGAIFSILLFNSITQKNLVFYMKLC